MEDDHVSIFSWTFLPLFALHRHLSLAYYLSNLGLLHIISLFTRSFFFHCAINSELFSELPFNTVCRKHCTKVIFSDSTDRGKNHNHSPTANDQLVEKFRRNVLREDGKQFGVPPIQLLHYNMFLHNLRAHLRDIRDRSVLRLFEAQDIGGVFPGALGVGAISIPAAVSNSSNACSGPPIAWDQVGTG